MAVSGVCKGARYKDNGAGSDNDLIASIILAVIMMGVLILAALPGNGAGIGIAMLITIIMALASGIIQLMAAVHFVPGFEIHGKLTYIILALLMAVFSIEEKKEA